MPVDKIIKSGFIDVPGAQLYYEVAGEGDPPILLLHGGLLDRHMWDEQFQFFAQHYQTIRYDMRGSGESKNTPSTCTLPERFAALNQREESGKSMAQTQLWG